MKRNFIEVHQSEIESKRQHAFSKKTDSNTDFWIKALQEFWRFKGYNTGILEEDKATINANIENFYLSVRTKKGEKYKTNSYHSMRNAIARFFKKESNWDIINDPEFINSNRVFSNTLKDVKAEGKGATEHHAVISKNDIHNIKSGLSIDDPQELQWLVFFYLQLYFCRRGIENVDTQKKDTYVIKEINGMDTVVLNRDELTKNRRENVTEKIDGGMIMSTGDEKCPLKCFKKYISKLDGESDYLWQRALPKNGNKWYSKSKCGHNTIQVFMKNISNRCGLTTKYTNHCIRSTSITLLGCSHSDIDITSVSGHRSISGLQPYKRTPINKKIEMTNTINDSLGMARPAVNSMNEIVSPEVQRELILPEIDSVVFPEPRDAILPEINLADIHDVFPELRDDTLPEMNLTDIHNVFPDTSGAILPEINLADIHYVSEYSNSGITVNFNNCSIQNVYTK